MVEPSLFPIGVDVSATTLASKLAPPVPPRRDAGRRAPVIRYTPEVLESIRALCAASFVTDGVGAPIVGLLYGTRTADELCLTAWVPAGELRNHNDAEYALKLQMRLAGSRPETAELDCLGWVRTRNHGEPRLAEEDEALHARCFGEPGQAVMIVRPSFQRPTKAAFYQREPDGAFRPSRPTQEFFLYPAHEGEIEPPIMMPVELPEPVQAAAPAVAAVSARDLELLPRGTVRAFSPWIATMLLFVGLLAGGGIASLRQSREAAWQQAIAGQEPLRIEAEASRWAIRWDPRLGQLEGAAGATLIVSRNGQSKTVSLPLVQLRRGFDHIDWVSDDMEIALRVERPGYPEAEQRIRVVGGGAGKPQAAAARRQVRTNL